MDDRPRLPVVLVFLAVGLLAGCSRAWQLGPVERERTAWYFEDLAHGIDRDYRELITADMSEPMERVATFARGSETPEGVQQLPQPFGRRRQRWELLRRAVAGHQVLIDDLGQFHLTADLEREVRAILDPAVVDENLDRIFGAEVLLRASGLRGDARAADELIALIQAAQRHHARDVGGRPWSANSPSPSGNAATPSTSAPDSSLNPDG